MHLRMVFLFHAIIQLNHTYMTIHWITAVNWLTPVIDMLCNNIVDFTEVEILASPIFSFHTC